MELTAVGGRVSFPGGSVSAVARPGAWVPDGCARAGVGPFDRGRFEQTSNGLGTHGVRTVVRTCGGVIRKKAVDWAAARFPDCCFRVLLCHKLLTHVLIADFARCPIAKP